jgi:hypothetical protein
MAKNLKSDAGPQSDEHFEVDDSLYLMKELINGKPYFAKADGSTLGALTPAQASAMAQMTIAVALADIADVLGGIMHAAEKFANERD